MKVKNGLRGGFRWLLEGGGTVALLTKIIFFFGTLIKKKIVFLR